MSYATTDELEVWLPTAVWDASQDELDPARQLQRASEVVDQALLTAVYAVSSAEVALDPAVRKALSDATCAQVEFWLAGSEDEDVLGPLASQSVGGLSEQYGSGEQRATPMYLAPRAARILRACPGIRW